MAKKNITSLTEARKRIFDIAEEVQAPETHYVLTEHGTPKAVVMSATAFASWEKTVSLVAKGIVTKKEIQKGNQYMTFKSLEDILEKEGFIAADKAKQTYDPSGSTDNKRNTRSRKRTKHA